MSGKYRSPELLMRALVESSGTPYTLTSTRSPVPSLLFNSLWVEGVPEVVVLILGVLCVDESATGRDGWLGAGIWPRAMPTSASRKITHANTDKDRSFLCDPIILCLARIFSARGESSMGLSHRPMFRASRYSRRNRW